MAAAQGEQLELAVGQLARPRQRDLRPGPDLRVDVRRAQRHVDGRDLGVDRGRGHVRKVPAHVRGGHQRPRAIRPRGTTHRDRLVERARPVIDSR